MKKLKRIYTKERNLKVSRALKGRKLSKEHCLAMSKALKGRPHTEKHNQALKKAAKKRKSEGKYNHSKETKRKISKNRKGKRKGIKHTKEWCKNISKALIGKKFSKDRLEKQRKSYTEERNLKISLALTGRSLSKKHRLAVSKGLTKTILLRKFNPKQYRGIRNSFYSKKNKCIIYCMSKMERAYCDLLEQMTEVKSYKMQPCRIQYTFNKEKHYYIPDILIIYKSRKQELVEIKPFCAIKDEIVQHKAKYAKKYCKENGLIFKFVTDKNIFC